MTMKNIAEIRTASAKTEHCTAPSVKLASRWARPSLRPKLVTFGWSGMERSARR
jgi:hypothetical protein